MEHEVAFSSSLATTNGHKCQADRPADIGGTVKITGIQTIAEGSGTAGHTVEYVLDSGAVIAVRFGADQAEVNRTNAVNQAKLFLERVVREGILPDQMEDGENVDGRAATMASSPGSPAKRLDDR